MNAVILYRIDDAKHMHRYYRMDVQPDLFGSWCLIREWGRIGSSGQLRSLPFDTPDEAQAALAKQRSTKEQRGYSIRAGAYCQWSEATVKAAMQQQGSGTHEKAA